uniref:Sodium/solute symporter n=1 Tax=Graphocephala atropunctata TaxID=36148 RepID=A0A1B6L9V3_9HEMI
MESVEEEPAMFGPEEFFVVALMLLVSLAIGVYFTFWSRQDSYSEYMLGGRKMGVFPIAMSLVASNISGIALVGNPAEVYSYGTLYSVALIADLVIPVVNVKMFLPVFYNLQLNSLYEYLVLRFSHGTRVLGSLIFTLSQIVYLPAIIYVPSLVFNQVSGVSVLLAASLICAVCIFYTTFGGLKAVLWTDAIQNLFSLGAVLFVVYLGVDRLGGVRNIFAINEQGGRLEFFNMDPSPFVRNSFWTFSIGNFGNWLVYLAINAGSTQRCFAMPSLAKAKRAMWWTAVGVSFVHVVTISMGMILYARYHGCDPVATGEIKKTGQMLPLFVTEITSNYPGLAGLFVSGVLSAALSSMSSSINTMAGTLYEDIVEFVYRGKKPSEAKQSFIMKVMTLLLGLLCVLLVLLVEKTESIFQLGMSLSGITNGALLTIFIMGLFIPRANSTLKLTLRSLCC